MHVGHFDTAKRHFASRQGPTSRACTLRQERRNDRPTRNGLGRASTAVQAMAIQAFQAYLRSMPAFDSLQEFIHRHRRPFVLTGAGCSANSGIPDYRDVDGKWKRQPPVMYRAFMAEEAARKRYWARSLIGWRHFVSRPSGLAPVPCQDAR
jgi:hypothetical protein